MHEVHASAIRATTRSRASPLRPAGGHCPRPPSVRVAQSVPDPSSNEPMLSRDRPDAHSLRPYNKSASIATISPSPAPAVHLFTHLFHFFISTRCLATRSREAGPPSTRSPRNSSSSNTAATSSPRPPRVNTPSSHPTARCPRRTAPPSSSTAGSLHPPPRASTARLPPASTAAPRRRASTASPRPRSSTASRPRRASTASPRPRSSGVRPPPATARPPPPQGQYGGAQQSQQPQRHSVTFRFSTPKTAILNSAVHDPYGKTPFSVHSPDKKHTIVSASNGSVIARIDWDHSSPVIEYGGKKIKAKEWIPFHKESQSRKLTFEGKVYNWTTRETTNYLEPSDRPGYSYVVWHDSTDDVILDVYQDALVIPGLLEAAILGVVLMQSGHPIGDVGGGKSSGTPYFGMALGAALGPVLAGAFH
ncbi:hypothetical protein FA95DRAFT_627262 [Auriscalpium vulgare]|uniref:Uncharacterized protein n=1 Tax=Auriscalpium vulgare TaxID=40419 RepID=A0ACB8RDQ2_9AGAM|nr:hypothetical protein FA95DRAFT_627262 [Auriscalpium vulgare]